MLALPAITPPDKAFERAAANKERDSMKHCNNNDFKYYYTKSTALGSK